jgi:hypothetical protein
VTLRVAGGGDPTGPGIDRRGETKGGRGGFNGIGGVDGQQAGPSARELGSGTDSLGKERGCGAAVNSGRTSAMP